MTDIIALPEEFIQVVERTFRLTPTSLFSTGLLSGEVLPHGPIVQRFRAALEFAPMVEERWREWDGLISDLGGMSGLIRAYDPARTGPYYNKVVATTTESWDDGTDWDDGTGWQSGKLPSSVGVDTAAVRGAESLVLDFPTGFGSLQSVLRRGDLFEIRPNGVPASHGHLYVVTRPANTDASGLTRVYFAPGLRTGVAAGDQVVLTKPTSVFRLQADDEGQISVTAPSIGRMGLSLVEVLPRA